MEHLPEKVGAFLFLYGVPETTASVVVGRAEAQGASVERKGVVEKAYVARKENQGGGTNPNPNDNGELG